MAAHVFSMPGVIERIIDGDSIVVHVKIMPSVELHGIHVRLQGINAPELRHEGGAGARDFLAAMLPSGTSVTLVSSQEDKYGRLLARVLLNDGSDASSHMLSSGNAVPMA